MGKWQNIPPDQKPNWARMNEGQRRYAYEQYNLALVRRGLNIEHPVPDTNETYNHRGDFDIDQVIDRPHPDEQRIVEELDNDTGDKDPSIEEILGNLPDAPESTDQEFDESYLEGDTQGNSDQYGSSMADSSLGTPTKPPNTGKRSSSDAGLAAGGGKRLPGTAQGQGSQGNELGEDSARPFKLPKPNTTITTKLNYYRKVHRFFTYGYAYQMINPTNVTICSMTTPLGLIPWDWLYFYLNPSEFAILPNQASVVKCKATVYQRNVRVAFPTNSTANALATLNQNKNVIYAVGLNKKIDSHPVKYTAFQTNQPMIPTAIQRYSYQDMVNDNNNWYSSQDNMFTVVPRHQTGQPDVLQYYAALRYSRPTGNTEPHDGWQCLQNFVEESDADATAGGELVSVEYHPKCGLIKQPHKLIQRKFNETITLNRGSYNLEEHNSVIPMAPNSVASTNSVVSDHDRNWTAQNSYSLGTNVQIIEKSQVYYEGLMKRDEPKVQPTLHVGVQPTYALTSTNTTVNQSFTDTQAYFEVVAECWVDTTQPTFRPLTNVTNVHETNYWERNRRPVAYGSPCVDGLYISSNPTV